MAYWQATMQERCDLCQNPAFVCQEPSVPLIQGRWEVFPDGKGVRLNPEKMKDCVLRALALSKTVAKTVASYIP